MNHPVHPNTDDTITATAAGMRRSTFWLRHALKKCKPTPRGLLKGGVLAVLLGSMAAAGANYLPKMAGQSRLTAVEAAQTAFALTNGGLITEAEFDMGRDGSRFEFEILSGCRQYDVAVDAMNGRAWLSPDED